MADDKCRAHTDAQACITLIFFSDQFAGCIRDRFQTFNEKAGDTWNQLHNRSHFDTQSKDTRNAVQYFFPAGTAQSSDSIFWGFFAAIICYIITLVMADMTSPAFQKFYDKMDGISIPQPFCQSFVPFAIVINKLLDKIPGFDKLNIDSEGMKKKFGLMGGR